MKNLVEEITRSRSFVIIYQTPFPTSIIQGVLPDRGEIFITQRLKSTEGGPPHVRNRRCAYYAIPESLHLSPIARMARVLKAPVLSTSETELLSSTTTSERVAQGRFPYFVDEQRTNRREQIVPLCVYAYYARVYLFRVLSCTWNKINPRIVIRAVRN